MLVRFGHVSQELTPKETLVASVSSDLRQWNEKGEAMAFLITMTNDAERQFLALSVRDQRILEAAISTRLTHEPTKESRSIKRLRPNSIAEFELRVGDLRALYVIDPAKQEVIIGVVGEKRGNKLFVEGREYHDHESAQS